MTQKRRVRIGIENLSFDASHYTPGVETECENLHGHTFIVNVEVEGEVDEKGMVLDFSELKKIVKEVLSSWDHSIIVPKQDIDKIKLEGVFKVKIKVIDYAFATTEYIAISIAKEIYEKTKLPVKVRVYEGLNKYASASYPAR